MREEIKNYERMELFNHFNDQDNPFAYITLEFDVTNLYKLCKKNRNHYATIGYYVVNAMNKIDEFKYRYEDGRIYKYDKIDASFTQMFENKSIGFFPVEMKDNYDEFIEEYKRVESIFLQNNSSIPSFNDGTVWLSCEPWFNFTGMITPINRKISIPEAIWDRFYFRDDKCYLHFMIKVHHGFVDGYHIGEFVNTFQQDIYEIENDKDSKRYFK